MAVQRATGLLTICKKGSNCKIGCRIGEGDLNAELLTGWIKDLNIELFKT